MQDDDSYTLYAAPRTKLQSKSRARKELPTQNPPPASRAINSVLRTTQRTRQPIRSPGIDLSEFQPGPTTHHCKRERERERETGERRQLNRVARGASTEPSIMCNFQMPRNSTSIRRVYRTMICSFPPMLMHGFHPRCASRARNHFHNSRNPRPLGDDEPAHEPRTGSKDHR